MNTVTKEPQGYSSERGQGLGTTLRFATNGAMEHQGLGDRNEADIWDGERPSACVPGLHAPVTPIQHLADSKPISCPSFTRQRIRVRISFAAHRANHVTQLIGDRA